MNGPNTLYSAPAKDFTDITSGNNEAFLDCSAYPGLEQEALQRRTGLERADRVFRRVPHGNGAF